MGLFKKNIKPKFQLETKHVVTHAFTIAGKKYFCFDDPFSMPYKRAFGALVYYEEFRMRCTREYLLAHYEATKEVLSKPAKSVVHLTELWRMNEHLGERLKFVFEPDALYKFASIVFFDESESPYDYDMKYCMEKIKFWKAHSEMKDFFLQQPLLRLVPYLRELNVSFQDYSKVIEEANKIHLTNLSSSLSDGAIKNDLMKSYGFAEATHQN